MKIIEALKELKAMKARQTDLIQKINRFSAHMTMDTPSYPDTKAQVSSWLQSLRDTNLEIERLALAISHTNNVTTVTLELDGKTISKSITAWIVRRREGIAFEQQGLSQLTNKNLKPALVKAAAGEDQVMNSVVLNFDTAEKDKKLALLMAEQTAISTALEIINATTDIVKL